MAASKSSNELLRALWASRYHPSEIMAMVKFKLSAEPDYAKKYKNKKNIPSPDEAGGYAGHAHAMCYYFLNMTSRSFARVIQELHPELRHPVCIFYLVLRGLDTVEDDMSLATGHKCRILRDFDKLVLKEGWTFNDSGPNEKDRELLVHFDVVIHEVLKLKPEYQDVIVDITKRMAHGMAEYCEGKIVTTLDDYNLYTHYVAGLVGIGLTRLFAASGLEHPDLLTMTKGDFLPNQMGLFLQKVNIIKDFLEDLHEGRRFWPKEIFSKYVNCEAGEGLEVFARPERLRDAMACLNELCVDALTLAPDCLQYMSLLQDPTVLRFCAIPQVMAIATLALFFNNPILFKKVGTKLRRGQTVQLMLQCGTFEGVKGVFYEHAQTIARMNRMRQGGTDKNNRAWGKEIDNSFMPMTDTCAKIIKWILEHDVKVGATRRVVAPPRRLNSSEHYDRIGTLVLSLTALMSLLILLILVVLASVMTRADIMLVEQGWVPTEWVPHVANFAGEARGTVSKLLGVSV